MKIMFKVSHIGKCEVYAVRVEKETDHFVTFTSPRSGNAVKSAKSSEYESFHDYFSDAKREYVKRKQARIDSMRGQIIDLEAKIDAADRLTEPRQ